MKRTIQSWNPTRFKAERDFLSFAYFRKSKRNHPDSDLGNSYSTMTYTHTYIVHRPKLDNGNNLRVPRLGVWLLLHCENRDKSFFFSFFREGDGKRRKGRRWIWCNAFCPVGCTRFLVGYGSSRYIWGWQQTIASIGLSDVSNTPEIKGWLVRREDRHTARSRW